MMSSIFKMPNMKIILSTGILFFLLSTSPLFAAYSGHVASYKNEENAVAFVARMKAKGLAAFYQKEDVPGKGEFYRSYIGAYKTRPLARKALARLKKEGVIDYFQIQKTASNAEAIAAKKMKTGTREQPAANKETVLQTASREPGKETMEKTDGGIKKPEIQKPDMTPTEYFDRGVENMAKEQYEAALDDLGKAISGDDKFAAAYNKRCYAFYMVGNVDSAIKDCTEAIILNPDFAEAYYNRGLANQAANQIKSAIGDFGKAIAMDAKYEAAYAKRGYMYYMSGRSKQAIIDFTAAIEIKPDDDEVYFNRALAYHDSGDADKALADVKKACALKNEQACRIAEDMSKN